MTYLIDAAKYYKGEPHQKAAWEALEAKLPKDTLEAFKEAYRAVQAPPKANPVPNSWAGIRQAAAECGAKYPQVVAAQWALESAYGRYISGKNNFFGIKGPGTRKLTWEDYGYGAVNVYASFMDFATPKDCVKYLIDRWYKDYRGYRGVNRARTWQECCALLKAEGYATDPNYVSKLITIINREEPKQ